MKIIRSKFIPFQGYKAINLFGALFVRGNAKIDDVTLNHEAIHSAQIKEVMLASIPAAVLLWIISNIWLAGLFVLASYYLWYVVEWAIHFIRLKDAHLAYRRISFEREAYVNEDDPEYLKRRAVFAFLKYLR